MTTMPMNEIKKLHLEEMVLFAINHIPQTDAMTLKRFLELVNAGGTFGVISHEQIMRKIYLVLKYIPNASVSSLLILMDLLDIKPSKQLMLNLHRDAYPQPGDDKGKSFLIELNQPVASSPKSHIPDRN